MAGLPLLAQVKGAQHTSPFPQIGHAPDEGARVGLLVVGAGGTVGEFTRQTRSCFFPLEHNPEQQSAEVSQESPTPAKEHVGT